MPRNVILMQCGSYPILPPLLQVMLESTALEGVEGAEGVWPLVSILLADHCFLSSPCFLEKNLLFAIYNPCHILNCVHST